MYGLARLFITGDSSISYKEALLLCVTICGLDGLIRSIIVVIISQEFI